MSDEIEVRDEQAGDEAAIRRVHIDAFGQGFEAILVDRLRGEPEALLSRVALVGDQVVAHALFARVKVHGEAPEGLLAGVGPMSVAPDLQRRGVGTALLEGSMEACRQAGLAALVVLGHPEYYPRFGFAPAAGFGLRCEYPVPPAMFMALELTDGALAGAEGVVRYPPEFRAV